MFEQLFGSKTRVKLMRLFLDNPEQRFYVRELTRLSDCLLNSVRRELNNLVALKLVLEQAVKKPVGEKRALNARRYYYLNVKNPFHHDLINLFSKGQLLIEKKFIERIKHLGDIRFFALTGFFVKDDHADTDILLVGDFDREKAAKVFKGYEKEINREVRYTIMNEDEYNLRKDIADGFLNKIIENERTTVVVDKISKKTKIKMTND